MATSCWLSQLISLGCFFLVFFTAYYCSNFFKNVVLDFFFINIIFFSSCDCFTEIIRGRTHIHGVLQHFFSLTHALPGLIDFLHLHCEDNLHRCTLVFLSFCIFYLCLRKVILFTLCLLHTWPEYKEVWDSNSSLQNRVNKKPLLC